MSTLDEAIKFSVIMPSYNLEEDFVKRAIESVLAQEYPYWELIYVDDNPTGSPYKDASRRLAAYYDDGLRIRFIFHEDNMGANRARNDGIAASSGDWLALLDADDYWDCCHLRKVAEKISETDCSLVSSSMRAHNGGGWRTTVRDHADGMVYEDALFKNIFGGCSSVCVRKDALLEVGGFDVSLPSSQDYDLFLRICKRFPVAFCQDITVNYVYGGHEHISTDVQRRIKGGKAVLDKILADDDISGELKRAVKNRHLQAFGYALLTNGYGRDARIFLRECTGAKAAFLCLASYASPLIPRLRSFANRFRYR